MSFQCPISSEITGGLFRQALSVAFMSILPGINFVSLPKILHKVLIICAITVLKALTTKTKEAREGTKVDDKHIKSYNEKANSKQIRTVRNACSVWEKILLDGLRLV